MAFISPLIEAPFHTIYNDHWGPTLYVLGTPEDFEATMQQIKAHQLLRWILTNAALAKLHCFKMVKVYMMYTCLRMFYCYFQFSWMKFRCQWTAPEGVLASLPWCLPKELKLKCFSVFSVERSTSHLSAFPSHWWCPFAYLGDSRWFNIFNPYRSSLQCSLKTTILWSLQQAQLHKPRAWVLRMVVLTMFGEVLSYTARWSSKVLEHTLCGVSRGWVCIEMSFCFLGNRFNNHSKQRTSSPFQLFGLIMLCIVILAGFYWGETWRNVRKTALGVCLELVFAQKLHKYTQYMWFLLQFFGGRVFWHFPENKVPKMACSIVQYIVRTCIYCGWFFIKDLQGSFQNHRIKATPSNTNHYRFFPVLPKRTGSLTNKISPFRDAGGDHHHH